MFWLLCYGRNIGRKFCIVSEGFCIIHCCEDTLETVIYVSHLTTLRMVYGTSSFLTHMVLF